MIYWLIIIFSTVLLSISISNPVYKLTTKKFLKLKFFYECFLRFFLFILSLILIMFALYLESLINIF